jgi:hypothetical protein
VANDLGRVVRRVDMGWPQWKVGVEYDGEQHFTNAVDYENDIVPAVGNCDTNAPRSCHGPRRR